MSKEFIAFRRRLRDAAIPGRQIACPTSNCSRVENTLPQQVLRVLRVVAAEVAYAVEFSTKRHGFQPDEVQKRVLLGGPRGILNCAVVGEIDVAGGEGEGEGKRRYRQDYLCEFVDDTDAVFSQSRLTGRLAEGILGR